MTETADAGRTWETSTPKNAEATITSLEAYHDLKPDYAFVEDLTHTTMLSRLRIDREAIPLTEEQWIRVDVLEVRIDEWRAGDAFREMTADCP